MIVAIDPGNTESAYVLWDGLRIRDMGKTPNEELLKKIEDWQEPLYIEMIASYGMTVGREVFETCVWIGRFIERSGGDAELIYRRAVKMHHCESAKAKDSNIIQALKDKYGDKGTKNAPGVTYGLSGDMWQAFAIATYITETQTLKKSA